MSAPPNVLILGGGVIGLTVAYELARDKVPVEVVDQGDFGQEASWAGAGILPPGNTTRARTPFERLLARSSERFPSLSQELREQTGIDNGYLRCGGIEILDADSETVVREWHELGLRAEVLSPAELRRLEPRLSERLGKVVHLPDMAQVRNPRHLKALLAGCNAGSVRLRPGCPVYGFERQGSKIVAAVTAAGQLTAGQFLIAAGAWSEALLEPLGWRPGIRPVRGQIALLNTAAPLFRRIIEDGKRYLVPRPDGRVLVGSTEEDVGFDKRTTAVAVRELLDFAIGLVPGLAAAQVERCWAGLRPGSPDGLPFLGAVPGTDNLFVAAGHFRAGLQLSPGTGLVMKELLLGQKPSIPLEAFRLDRAAFRS